MARETTPLLPRYDESKAPRPDRQIRRRSWTDWAVLAIVGLLGLAFLLMVQSPHNPWSSAQPPPEAIYIAIVGIVTRWYRVQSTLF